jgi:hypothetical protein
LRGKPCDRLWNAQYARRAWSVRTPCVRMGHGRREIRCGRRMERSTKLDAPGRAGRLALRHGPRLFAEVRKLSASRGEHRAPSLPFEGRREANPLPAAATTRAGTRSCAATLRTGRGSSRACCPRESTGGFGRARWLGAFRQRVGGRVAALARGQRPSRPNGSRRTRCCTPSTIVIAQSTARCRTRGSQSPTASARSLRFRSATSSGTAAFMTCGAREGKRSKAPRPADRASSTIFED